MLIIDQATNINLITSSTASLSIHESSIVLNTNGVNNIVANVSQVNTATSTSIISGPGVGLQKQLKTLVIVNTDTIQNIIYLTYSVSQLIPRITLLSGECITYTGEQYRHYSATGSDITNGVIPGPQGIQGIQGQTGATNSNIRNIQTGTTYSVFSSDVNKIIALSNTATRTITLCSASAINSGNIIWFSDESSSASIGNIIINTVGSDTINFGTTSYIMDSDGIVSGIYSDGINAWYLFQDNAGTYTGTALLDFGSATQSSDTATITVPCTWINPNNKLSLTLEYKDTADHLADEVLLENLKILYGNIVNGVSFDIIGYSPDLTYGKFSVFYQKIH